MKPATLVPHPFPPNESGSDRNTTKGGRHADKQPRIRNAKQYEALKRKGCRRNGRRGSRTRLAPRARGAGSRDPPRPESAARSGGAGACHTLPLRLANDRPHAGRPRGTVTGLGSAIVGLAV